MTRPSSTLLLPIKRNLVLYVVPVVFLTALGLIINFNDLFPHILPAITFIFIVSLCVVIYRAKLSFITLLIVFYLINTYVFPRYIAMGKHITGEEPFDGADKILISGNGDTVKIDYNNNTVLLDFMFLRCKSCWEKLSYLQALEAESDIDIYVIVDGRVDKDINSFFGIMQLIGRIKYAD